MRSDNLVVLRGHLSSPPKRRELPSGSVLLTLEVTTAPPTITNGAPGDHAAAVSVPVVWFDPPASAAVQPTTEVLTEVVVTGHVRRRFFRAGGVTQSRTEVVADAVIPASRRSQVDRALRRVFTALEPAG